MGVTVVMVQNAEPINATDTCCEAHDDSVFGYGDSCYDKELVS